MKSKILKRVGYLSAVLFALISITTPHPSFASTKGGIKPGSFFYTIDIFLEKADLAFTFDKEKRFQKIMNNAEERLEEAEVAMSENKPIMVEKALSSYQKGISSAVTEAKGVSNEEKREDLLSLVDKNVSKHKEVLISVYDKAPEASKEAIKQAIAVSSSATSKPSIPATGKCGDGVCDNFEKANLNVCPRDCSSLSSVGSSSVALLPCDINKDGKVDSFENKICEQKPPLRPSQGNSSSSSLMPTINKCGDGVCGPIEKANPNLCPRDCVSSASSSSSSYFSSSKSSISSMSSSVSVSKSSSSMGKIILSSSYRLPFGMLTSFYPPERTSGERPTEYKWEISSNENLPFSTAFDIGIGWERASHPILDWSFVQKSADDLINKKYDWSVSDNYIKKVPAFLNLVITLNVGDSRLNAGTWQFPNPILKTEYANFVKAAVERYDGDGINDMAGLKSPVKYWQFENEPVSHINKTGEKPQPNYDWEGFSELMKITYESIKSADSSARVLIAGTVDAEPQRQNILDNFWLPLIGNLNGKYVDIFDIHWFSKWQDSYAFYNQFKNKMNQSGFSQTPVWITENGSSSKDGEDVQAKDLVKRMVYPLSYGVKKVFWAWGLVEGWPPFKCDSMFDYTGLIYDGVCSPDEGYGVKKLGYYTYKKLIETLNGSNFDNIQKIQESGGVYVYKFPRQGRNVWVAWNENSESKQVTIHGINSSSIKITEAVPKYKSGKEVSDYSVAFKTETKSISGGNAIITISDIPLIVEEK